MPFTFSHPAIILPLRYLPRKWFSLTGLVIGSLTPDFEYFIRMKVQSIYSHTFYGIFWFDLPLAILLTFIFHNIVRNDLYNNLPQIIKSRVLVFSNFNWNTYFKTNWIVVIISIIIGIASHILWDGFTHDHGYFVDHIAELRKSISLFNIEIPVLKIAQHLSSLIGAIVILYAISELPQNDISQTQTNKSYWIYVILFTALIIIIRFLNGFDFKAYGNIIVSVISAIFISVILTPLFTKAIRKN